MCNDYEHYPFRQEDKDLWDGIGRLITPAVETVIDGMMADLALHSAQTAQHSENVAAYVQKFAQESGLAPGAVTALTQATRLHDIGKLSFSAALLDAKTDLSDKERQDLKYHPIFGEQIILMHEGLPAPFRALAASMAIGHHENYNGDGYPYDLKAKEISIEARVVALADTLDARANRGGYQAAIGIAATLKEMNDPDNSRMAGRFDPALKSFFTNIFQTKKPSPLAEKRLSQSARPTSAP